MGLCLQIKAICYFFKVVSAKTPFPTRPGRFFAAPGKIWLSRACFFPSRESGSRPGSKNCCPGRILIVPGQLLFSGLMFVIVAHIPFHPVRISPENEFAAFADFVNSQLQVSIGLVANLHGFAHFLAFAVGGFFLA